MTTTEEQLDMTSLSMADVALKFPQALGILQKYNLDYCCGGKKPFTEVCRKMDADPAKVWDEIILVQSNHHGSGNRMNFNTWDVPLIIDFILQHHHEYVRSSIPQIEQLLEKVCEAHSEDSPDLLLLRSNFKILAKELLDHMPKEENILFPAMRDLFNAESQQHLEANNQRYLAQPIAVMEHEHESAGELIKSIRVLAQDYTPPAYACPTFKMTYLMLEQFDQDLMQHIHIENNILFPKAKLKPIG